jgi:hypothetical protein
MDVSDPVAGYGAYARSGGPVKSEEDPLDPAPVREMRETLAAIRHLEEATAAASRSITSVSTASRTARKSLALSGMTEQLLTAAIDAGELKPQPTRPLATVVIGALDEAALSIANADDPEQEKADVRKVIHNLIDGLLINPRRPASARKRP